MWHAKSLKAFRVLFFAYPIAAINRIATIWETGVITGFTTPLYVLICDCTLPQSFGRNTLKEGQIFSDVPVYAASELYPTIQSENM